MPVTPQAVKIKETGVVFVNARECAAAIGGDYSSVYACLRGVRSTHKGYSFEYVEVEEDE